MSKKTPTKDELILANQLLEKQLVKYQKGFYILHEYFDSIADEEKPKVDKKLNKLGL